MGFLLRPRITEREAAALFLDLLADSVQRTWPRIFEAVRPSFRERVAVIDHRRAAETEFFLAAVALHLAEMPQVLSPSRALRLGTRIEELVLSPPFCPRGDPNSKAYVTETLRQYRSAGDASGPGGIARCLRERLGATLSARSAAGTPSGPEPDDALAAILENFGGSWWRSFARKYRIREAGAREGAAG